MENPNRKSSYASHLDPNIWSFSTASPKGIGGMAGLGLAAFTIHCPIDACLVNDGIIKDRNVLRLVTNQDFWNLLFR